jgi:hypothetical protein
METEERKRFERVSALFLSLSLYLRAHRRALTPFYIYAGKKRRARVALLFSCCLEPEPKNM